MEICEALPEILAIRRLGGQRAELSLPPPQIQVAAVDVASDRCQQGSSCCRLIGCQLLGRAAAALQSQGGCALATAAAAAALQSQSGCQRLLIANCC